MSADPPASDGGTDSATGSVTATANPATTTISATSSSSAVPYGGGSVSNSSSSTASAASTATPTPAVSTAPLSPTSFHAVSMPFDNAERWTGLSRLLTSTRIT